MTIASTFIFGTWLASAAPVADPQESAPPAAKGTTATTSEDGELIVFSSNRGGRFSLFTCKPDGTSVEPVPGKQAEGMDEVHPAWSPVGDRIAFASGTTLCLLDWDSRIRRSLEVTVDPEIPLVWSPKGDRLICMADDKLVFVDVETRASTLAARESITGTWMPDGGRLLVSRGQIPVLQILEADGTATFFLKGGQETRPTLIPQMGGVWSDATPRRIAFSTCDLESTKESDESHDVDVFVAAEDGSEPTQVFATPGPDWAWAWSSDGKALLVSSGAPEVAMWGDDEESAAPDLHIVWVGTDKQLNLTRDRAAERGASWRRRSAPVPLPSK